MVYALDISNPTQNPIAKFSTFATLLNVVVPFITIVAAFSFLGLFLWGGYLLITAGGNAERVKQAQKTITFSVVGLIIIVVAYLIVNIIETVLNINGLPI